MIFVGYISIDEEESAVLYVVKFTKSEDEGGDGEGGGVPRTALSEDRERERKEQKQYFILGRTWRAR